MNLIIAHLNEGPIPRLTRHHVRTAKEAERLARPDCQLWMQRDSILALGCEIEMGWGRLPNGAMILIASQWPISGEEMNVNIEEEQTMTTTTATGWIACDYTQGDTLADVRHGHLHGEWAAAAWEQTSGGYEGIRYLHRDGYLYVDAPEDARDRERDL